MVAASFTDLADRAQMEPVVSSLPPLASFYLDDIAIYRSLEAFHRDLYDPDYRFDQDVIIDAETRHPRYRFVECTANPVTPSLNDVVQWDNSEHHDRLRRDLLCQSRIKDYILDTVTTEDFVALIIVDGLSYEVMRDSDLSIQPVVVDGITTTEPGFRRVIYGGNSVSMYAALLNSKEFYTVFGFTYWGRGQEALSTDLHASMGPHVHRIRDFEEALTMLDSEAPFDEKVFVQITRMGFDQDSHNRKEEPNKDAVRDKLITDIEALADQAAQVADDYRIFATADHGILWREHLPDDPPIVHDDRGDHPRFLEGAQEVPHSLTQRNHDGTTATGLAYPYLTRELKHTEWGVHGGFSYYESIVPLIEVSNKDGDTA